MTMGVLLVMLVKYRKHCVYSFVFNMYMQLGCFNDVIKSI